MTPATGRILLIEDDDGIADLLTTAFILEGHAVVAVPAYARGITQLQSERFDLVVTDTAESARDPTLTFLDDLLPHLGSARLVLTTAHAAAAQIETEGFGLAAVWLQPYDDLHALLAEVQTLVSTT